VDRRPWLERILLPGGPWWVALPCEVLAGVALVLLVIDPSHNLTAALCLIGPAALAIYGTVFLKAWQQRRHDKRPAQDSEG
jgi:hypothetical protein